VCASERGRGRGRGRERERERGKEREKGKGKGKGKDKRNDKREPPPPRQSKPAPPSGQTQQQPGTQQLPQTQQSPPTNQSPPTQPPQTQQQSPPTHQSPPERPPPQTLTQLSPPTHQSPQTQQSPLTQQQSPLTHQSPPTQQSQPPQPLLSPQSEQPLIFTNGIERMKGWIDKMEGGWKDLVWMEVRFQVEKMGRDLQRYLNERGDQRKKYEGYYSMTFFPTLVMAHLKACGGEMMIARRPGGKHTITFNDVSQYKLTFDSLEIPVVVQRTAQGGGLVGFFITKECPMQLIFSPDIGKLTISFFVQGYNQYGIPMCLFPSPKK
jgi:hypothetical protein